MNLAISFSGGKTSAYMTHWLLKNKMQDFDKVVITFANTGQENEETLDFVNRCDKEWDLNVIWLEALVDPIVGKGTRFKQVTFETASRNGEPFEDYIKKHGIPNQAAPKCTYELKLAPMNSYLRSLGWKNGTYKTAIGIRADEIDRVSSKMVEQNLIYPLVEYTKATKESINRWWDNQPFTLNLKEHEGNCKWCWKKSKRKLLTLAKDTPEIFDFPIMMEDKYKWLRADNTPDNVGRVFFRGNTTGRELIEQSKQHFRRWEPDSINFDMFDFEMDAPNGCSESCEVY